MENAMNGPEATAAKEPHQPGAVSVYGQGDALDDFPVLKAFQQYIDSEQVKAHKRLMMVCTFFSILVIVVVAIFLAIIANLRTGDHSAEATIKALSENNSNLQKQLLDQSVRMNDQFMAQIASRRDAEAQAASAADAELQRKNLELQAKLTAMEMVEKRLKEDASRRDREDAERRRREAAEAEKRAAALQAQEAEADSMTEKVKKLRQAELLLREKVRNLKERESRIAEDEKRLHDKEVRLQQEKLYGPQTKSQPDTPEIDPTDAELDALALPPETAPQQPAPAAPKATTRPTRQQSDGSLRYFDDEADAQASAAPAPAKKPAAPAAAPARTAAATKKAPAAATASNLQIGDWTIPLD